MSISMPTLSISPIRQRMYIATGQSAGDQLWADITLTGTATSSAAITKWDVDWKDGFTDSYQGNQTSLSRTHRYIFNHLGTKYFCGMGHKVVSVTVTNNLGETATKEFECWAQSDYIRLGVWSNGTANEDTYETFWNRGWGTFKSTQNYESIGRSQPPNGPGTLGDRVLKNFSTAYPKRHCIPEWYIKTGNQNGILGEPGGKTSCYNLTWYHIANNLRCDPIHEPIATPDVDFPAWPPNGVSYLDRNGNSSSPNNPTTDTWLIDHFRQLKEWGEPFWYCFDGEPERCLDIHNTYWNSPNRQGQDATRNPTNNPNFETSGTWRQAFNKVVSIMRSIGPTANFAGTGVPNCLGIVVDLLFNTVDPDVTAMDEWATGFTEKYGYISASRYLRFNDGNTTGAKAWEKPGDALKSIWLAGQRVNKPIYADEYNCRPDDAIENVNSITKVSGTTWRITPSGTSELAPNGGPSGVNRAEPTYDVNLTGFSPGVWNTRWTVTAVTATTFDIQTTISVAPTALGNVQYTGRRAKWMDDSRLIMKGALAMLGGTLMGHTDYEGWNSNSAEAGQIGDAPYCWKGSESGGDYPTEDAYTRIATDPAFMPGWDSGPPPPPPPSGLYDETGLFYNDSSKSYGGADLTLVYNSVKAIDIASGVDSFLSISGGPLVYDSVAAIDTAIGVDSQFTIIGGTGLVFDSIAAIDIASGRVCDLFIAGQPIPDNLLPPMAIHLITGSSSRWLNDNRSNPIFTAAEVEFASVVNGGHSEFSCYVALDEFLNNPSIYKYGTIVQVIRLDEIGMPSPPVKWEGFLKAPMPDQEGRVKLIGTGWGTALTEREDDLLWQDRYPGSWEDTSSDDTWGSGFANDDSLSANVKKATLEWQAKKGTAIKNGDTARLGWYFENQLVDRVAGIFHNKIANPGSQYLFQLVRYDGPLSYATRQVIYNFTSELASAGQDSFDQVLGAKKPAITFELVFNAANKDLAEDFIPFLSSLRVNGDAYRNAPPNWDVYTASEVVRDIAVLLGYAVGRITTTSRNILPLWWQDGPLSDLLDYVAMGGAASSEFRWMVWEQNSLGKPVLEFSSWGSSVLWTANCYSAGATALANLAPNDDLFSRVCVKYRTPGSSRTRTAYEPVVYAPGNPYLSLPGPGILRKRTFTFSLSDPCSRNFAHELATNIAADLSTEQYSGTITLAFANNNAGGLAPSYEIRAGDMFRIPDFPYGDKQFRIFEARHFETHTELTIGDTPMRQERLLWWWEKRRARKGRISSTPQ